MPDLAGPFRRLHICDIAMQEAGKGRRYSGGFGGRDGVRAP